MGFLLVKVHWGKAPECMAIIPMAIMIVEKATKVMVHWGRAPEGWAMISMAIMKMEMVMEKANNDSDNDSS